jgi:hypothetical protein
VCHAVGKAIGSYLTAKQIWRTFVHRPAAIAVLEIDKSQRTTRLYNCLLHPVILAAAAVSGEPFTEFLGHNNCDLGVSYTLGNQLGKSLLFFLSPVDCEQMNIPRKVKEAAPIDAAPGW